MRIDPEDFAAVIAEDRRRAHLAVKDFVMGVEAADKARIAASFNDLDNGSMWGAGWRKAFQQVAKLPAVPNAARTIFAEVWHRYGDHIRLETGDDLALVSGLRMLMPPYRGPSAVLHRGDSALNRRRRTYGLSWSASREVADSFAKGNWRFSHGGSVLLRAQVPADAIICDLSNDYGEAEFIVDRRGLGKVEVLARYSGADEWGPGKRISLCG